MTSAAENHEECTTLFVSDGLQSRLDDYREADPSRTNTSLVFEAIDALRDEIPAVVDQARVRIASPGRQAHDLGSGPVRVHLHLTRSQAAVLDKLTGLLGLQQHSAWIPALLNAHLPGRKEPENMPWLTRDAG